MAREEDIVSYIGTIWDFIQGLSEDEIRDVVLDDAKAQEEAGNDASWILENIDDIVYEAAREVEVEKE